MAALNDVGAYVAGRAIGRHPMAPAISPSKTWEGFAGGTIATMIASAVVAWQLDPPFTLGRALILGALVALAAPAGDLIESAMKREAGIKDAGGLIPGHGGALDLIDSLLISAPVFFYAFRAMIR
jgi:phosphatidate cytidylyltransferase